MDEGALRKAVAFATALDRLFHEPIPAALLPISTAARTITRFVRNPFCPAGTAAWVGGKAGATTGSGKTDLGAQMAEDELADWVLTVRL